VFGAVAGTAVRTFDGYGHRVVYYRRFPPGGWVEKYAPAGDDPGECASSPFEEHTDGHI